MLVVTTQQSQFALLVRADAERSHRSCKQEVFKNRRQALSEWKRRRNSGFTDKQQAPLLRDVETSTPSLSVSSAEDPVKTFATPTASVDCQDAS